MRESRKEWLTSLRGSIPRLPRDLDFKDLKDRAAYYMYQYEWLQSAAPDKYTAKVDRLERFLLNQGKFWYGADKAGYYGRQSYERIKHKLSNVPREFRNMDDNTPISLQRGDADLVPPVEITKYYKDRNKLYLAERYRELSELLKNEDINAPYFSSLKKLTEAIGVYSKLQCAVTDDSFELELASLDTFSNEAENYFVKKRRLNLDDPVTRIVADIIKKNKTRKK